MIVAVITRCDFGACFGHTVTLTEQNSVFAVFINKARSNVCTAAGNPVYVFAEHFFSSFSRCKLRESFVKNVDFSDESFANHRNQSHCCGLEYCKILSDIAQFSVKANSKAFKKRFEIVACETEDMMHRKNREKNFISFVFKLRVSYVCNKV